MTSYAPESNPSISQKRPITSHGRNTYMLTLLHVRATVFYCLSTEDIKESRIKIILPGLIRLYNCYSLCSNLIYAWRVAIIVLRYIVQLFIVFLMLYKYNSLKKQNRVLPPNGISSNYQGCIVLCILCFVDECSSTEMSVGVFAGSLVACFIATAVISTFLQMIICQRSKSLHTFHMCEFQYI